MSAAVQLVIKSAQCEDYGVSNHRNNIDRSNNTLVTYSRIQCTTNQNNPMTTTFDNACHTFSYQNIPMLVRRLIISTTNLQMQFLFLAFSEICA